MTCRQKAKGQAIVNRFTRHVQTRVLYENTLTLKRLPLPKDVLEVRESHMVGKGTFAKRSLKKNSFVTDIPITPGGTHVNYTLDLEKKIIATEARVQWSSVNLGSVCKRINHSCCPNTRMVHVVCKDGYVHLVLQALEPIAAGTEITFYYGDHYLSDRNIKCQCPQCAGADGLGKPMELV